MTEPDGANAMKHAYQTHMMAAVCTCFNLMQGFFEVCLTLTCYCDGICFSFDQFQGVVANVVEPIEQLLFRSA